MTYKVVHFQTASHQYLDRSANLKIVETAACWSFHKSHHFAMGDDCHYDDYVGHGWVYNSIPLKYPWPSPLMPDDYDSPHHLPPL